MEFNELGKRTYENVQVMFQYDFEKIVIDKEYIKNNQDLPERLLIGHFIVDKLLDNLNRNLLIPTNIKFSEPWVEIEVHTKKPQNY